MNRNLLDGIHPLIKNVLDFVDLAKSTLAEQLYLLEKSVVPVLLEVLVELVVRGKLLIPEDKSVAKVLAARLMLLNLDERYEVFLRVFNVYLRYSSLNWNHWLCLCFKVRVGSHKAVNSWHVRNVIHRWWN